MRCARTQKTPTALCGLQQDSEVIYFLVLLISQQTNTECCCCRKEEQKHCLQTSADKFTVLVLINKSLTVTIADLSPRSYTVKHHLLEIFTRAHSCACTHTPTSCTFTSSFSKGQIPGRGSPSGLGVVLPRAGFYHPAAAVLPAVLPSSLQNGCNHAVVLESGSDPAPCPQPPPAGPHAPSAPEPQPAVQGAVSSCPTGGARVP